MAWRTWSLARYGSASLKSRCSNSSPGTVTLVVFGAWAGLEKPVFHPTVRAMWAGTRLPNRLCQSAKGVVYFTVTVLPLGHIPTLRSAAEPGSQAAPPVGFDPVTVAIWL